MSKTIVYALGVKRQVWPRVPLHQVVERFEGGKSLVATGEQSTSRNLRVLKISAIRDSGVDFDESKPLPDDYEPLPSHYVREGDLLITRANTAELVGTVALVAQAPENILLPDKIWRFVWRQPASVEPRFVRWLFRDPTTRSAIAGMATGTSASMKNISQAKLYTLEIPLPSLDEQHRIAAILDQADALRDKRRQALAQVEQLTQSVFLEMFGGADWDVRSLGDLLEPIDSGKSPVCETRQAHPGEWSVLKLGALSKGFFDPSENKALKPGTEPDERFEVRVGDLLFTRKNTYDLVGTTAIVRETPGRQLLPDLIFRLTPKTDGCLHAEYLNVLFRQAQFRGLLQSIASGSSSSMPNISKSRLQSVKLSLPPIALQHQFARRVEAIERLKAAHRRSLEEMDALFASLQHRAFRGEL